MSATGMPACTCCSTRGSVFNARSSSGADGRSGSSWRRWTCGRWRTAGDEEWPRRRSLERGFSAETNVVESCTRNMRSSLTGLTPTTVTQGAVITKAALRAAGRLGVSNKTLGKIIGVSEATVSRMGSGTYALSPGDKPFELAVLFVRLFRALDAMVGGDEAAAAVWLKSENLALGLAAAVSVRIGPCMSFPTWTPDALARTPASIRPCRVVEAHRVSTWLADGRESAARVGPGRHEPRFLPIAATCTT